MQTEKFKTKEDFDNDYGTETCGWIFENVSKDGLRKIRKIVNTKTASAISAKYYLDVE